MADQFDGFPIHEPQFQIAPPVYEGHPGSRRTFSVSSTFNVRMCDDDAVPAVANKAAAAAHRETRTKKPTKKTRTKKTKTKKTKTQKDVQWETVLTTDPGAAGKRLDAALPVKAVLSQVLLPLVLEPYISPGAPGGKKHKDDFSYTIYEETHRYAPVVKGGTERPEVEPFFRLPRAYGLSAFPKACAGWHDKALAALAAEADRPGLANYSRTLWPFQQVCMDHVLHMLRTLRCHGGLLHAECGAGKTGMGLYAAHMLGLPTLIVMHTGELAKQWLQRIPLLLPNAKVGLLQGPNRPDEDSDVCVAMLQTLHMIPRAKAGFLRRYGFLIVDECHHICCRTFSVGLRLCRPAFTLGLSATPERTDKLDMAIEWLVGPKLYEVYRLPQEVHVQMIEYVNQTFQPATRRWAPGEMDYVKTISLLVDDEYRTETLAKHMQEAVNEGRDCISISPRLRLLKDLHAQLPEEEVGLLLGGATTKAKKARNAAALTKKNILASTGVASEGLDVPNKDTLFNTLPMKRGPCLQQCVGRVMRGGSRKVPRIVDFFDNYKAFRGMAMGRRRYYEERGYTFLPLITEVKPLDEDEQKLAAHWAAQGCYVAGSEAFHVREGRHEAKARPGQKPCKRKREAPPTDEPVELPADLMEAIEEVAAKKKTAK